MPSIQIISEIFGLRLTKLLSLHNTNPSQIVTHALSTYLLDTRIKIIFTECVTKLLINTPAILLESE